MRDLASNTIGYKIRSIRIRKGLTQADIAEAAGIGESAIRNYELSYRNPSKEALNKIANALKVSPDCFKPQEMTTPSELIQTLFRYESLYMVEPTRTETSFIGALSEPLAGAFIDWSFTRSRYMRGEITKEEYEDWKDSYTLREG